jgi:hypothetical protein
MIDNRGYILLSFLMALITLVLQACRMEYAIDAPANVTVNRDAELVQEGKRLTLLMCATCHLDESTKSFTGKRLHDSPGIVGKIYAANITKHTRSGIGRYSDEELKYLLRTGVSREGKLMPYMLRPNLADGDINAIITFLRSDDPLVVPKEQQPPRTRYTAIGKFGVSQVKPVPYRAEVIHRPAEGTLELGKYLVDNLGCYHCHSKSFLTLDSRSPERSKGFMGGGNKLKGADGKTIKTSNLTFHSTGLASWTVDDLKKLLLQGITPDNKIIRYPMPLFAELTDGEINSIYRYLKQIPHIKNENDH